MSGSLNLIDDDVLTTDNLNRVSFATLASALAGAQKVTEAETLLRRCCPNLAVTGFPETFGTYKQRIPRRVDRLYDVVITGLDDDQIRWEVQRDLPRILIDGATGKDMVARVERVEFGRYGCLGCSRRPAPIAAEADLNCDAAPDPHAPSLSFLSSFPGILAAGELIKEAMGSGQLRGHFDHVFRYGPNPDLAGMPALRPDCQAECGRPSKLAQYRQKYRP
ncbi:MAG: ThiF family adenylyltransferase [Streptosporangiaceae bacterium]